MRPVRTITAFVFAAAVAVTGCAAHSTAAHPSAAAAPAAPVAQDAKLDRPAVPSVKSPGRTVTRQPVSGAPQRVYFASPEASMRYLSAAYNRNDLAALKHVTTPEARTNLQFMRPNAVNLRLVGCSANAGHGDYTCSFSHDFPAASHRSGHGQAHFTVAPADRVGWYMTVLEDCD
jgi:hypothetical protein